MRLKFSKKAESDGGSLSMTVKAIIMIIVVGFVLFGVSDSFIGNDGFEGSIGGLGSNVECQFNPESCDNEIDTGKITCDFDRNNLGPLQFDISKSDLELKQDYESKYKSKLGDNQFRDIENLANKLNMEPQYLFAVIDFETGGKFSTSIKNGKNSGATGLIQFMPNTAKDLGTTTEELSKMTVEEQLGYVEKYFNQFNGRNYDSLDKVYMDVLYPKAHGKGLDYVLFVEGCKAYEQNSALDDDEDGYVIVAEAVQKVVDHYNR